MDRLTVPHRSRPNSISSLNRAITPRSQQSRSYDSRLVNTRGSDNGSPRSYSSQNSYGKGVAQTIRRRYSHKSANSTLFPKSFGSRSVRTSTIIPHSTYPSPRKQQSSHRQRSSSSASFRNIDISSIRQTDSQSHSNHSIASSLSSLRRRRI